VRGLLWETYTKEVRFTGFSITGTASLTGNLQRARKRLMPNNTVSDIDLKFAAQRQETYLKSQTGTISGTILQAPQKKRLTSSWPTPSK